MARKTTVTPHISVIIPAYREASGINGTIANVRRTAAPFQVEIIVADGAPECDTLAVISDEQVVRVESPQGRSRQMNAGAAIARGDVLLFLHADTRLPEGWPMKVLATLTGTVVAGAFSLSIDSPSPLLTFISRFANLRSRWERVPYGDQAQFITAEAFRRLDGYAEIPIMEDVELFRRIRMDGDDIVILRDKVVTSARRWESEGVLRRTLRNWWMRIRYAFGVSPNSLVADYRPQGENDGERSGDCLIMFVKFPEPGKVKTRLARDSSRVDAASFYAALVEEKVATLSESVQGDLLVFFDPPEAEHSMVAWLGEGRKYIAQEGADLGLRMENAFRTVFRMGYARAVLVGSDIPGLTPCIINDALAALTPRTVSIGPASDGGYYLIGFHRSGFLPACLRLQTWSNGEVCRQTVYKLEKVGATIVKAPILDDVDTLTDLRVLLAREAAGPLTGHARELAMKLVRR